MVPSRTNTKPRGPVTFAEKIPSKIIEVRERESFTEEEKETIWYNKKEITKLQKQVKKIILNKADLDPEDTNRGLEYHVAQHRREQAASEGRPDTFTRNKQKLLAAARANNKRRNKTDIESLAHKFNHDAILQCEMLGALDTAEAYSIYLETMDAELVNKCFQGH